VLQKRAPAVSGEPQPVQNRWLAGAAGAGVACGADVAAGAAAADAGADEDCPAGPELTGAPLAGAACWPCAGAAAAGWERPGTAVPHCGHAVQRASSMTALQLAQRIGANGSFAWQNGQTATSRMMNCPQRGHGTL
jgi:hypothetical protein